MQVLSRGDTTPKKMQVYKDVKVVLTFGERNIKLRESMGLEGVKGIREPK